jgi:hypothetical protein
VEIPGGSVTSENYHWLVLAAIVDVASRVVTPDDFAGSE